MPRQDRNGAWPPKPPAELAAGLGAGDYWEVGQLNLRCVEEWAGIDSQARILDLGCGLGRFAAALSQKEPYHGTYLGFDTARVYVDWCRDALQLDPSRYEFIHLDVANTSYNPGGKLRPESVRFPWQTASFDLGVACSLFTHMGDEGVANYLRETRRVLAPNGRLFATFFLLDELSLSALEAGHTYQEFPDATRHGRVGKSSDPDAAVALDRAWLHEMLAAIGWTCVRAQDGQWRGDPQAAYFQDVLVLAPTQVRPQP